EVTHDGDGAARIWFPFEPGGASISGYYANWKGTLHGPGTVSFWILATNSVYVGVTIDDLGSFYGIPTYQWQRQFVRIPPGTHDLSLQFSLGSYTTTGTHLFLDELQYVPDSVQRLGLPVQARIIAPVSPFFATLRFPEVAGHTYVVIASFDLSGWRVKDEQTAAATGETEITVLTDFFPTQFYQVLDYP
ncbi:MAG TPA: hypothetical protein VHH73_20125, partial [Verrucomicrobiae bacterium]|nr:hypothetical protein [Verrucomicrobiae bacterium]